MPIKEFKTLHLSGELLKSKLFDVVSVFDVQKYACTNVYTNMYIMPCLHT